MLSRSYGLSLADLADPRVSFLADDDSDFAATFGTFAALAARGVADRIESRREGLPAYRADELGSCARFYLSCPRYADCEALAQFARVCERIADGAAARGEFAR